MMVNNQAVSQYFFSVTKVKRIHNMNGIQNRDSCIRDLISSSNCTKKCNPLILSFLKNPSIDICQKSEDFLCNLELVGLYNGQMHKCLNPKSTSEFTISLSSTSYNVTNPLNVSYIDFRFKFIASRTEIQREKPIISYRDFIGSVGGSLGLFLGLGHFWTTEQVPPLKS